MASAQTFLGYVARVAVDRLTGSPERTDEGVQILRDWAGQRDAKTISSGMAEARDEAYDPTILREALDKAAAENDQVLSDEQRATLEFTVVSGLSLVSGESQSGVTTIDTLVEQLIPGKSRVYVIWLDTPEFVTKGETGRYFHFSYDGESYRVRDYVGGNIFHPIGRKVADKEWNVTELKMSASQIWNVSKGQIRCTKEFGLYFPVSDRVEWRRMLLLLTNVAKQFQQ